MPPTTTLKALRQDIIKKLYAPKHPIVSATTSDSDATSVLKDSFLSPCAQDVDFLKAWIHIAEQPTKVDSGVNIGEDLDVTETVIDVASTGAFLVGDDIQVDSEIMGPISSITLNTNITVTRAIQGTTAAIHTSGADIYIIGPAVRETTRVTNSDFSGGASTLTITPALSGSLISGTDYELHYKYHPSFIEDRVNEILGNLETEYLIPLSIITDGDMESSGTTDWTASAAVGTAPTLSKDVAIVLHGRQALKILANADATNSYAKSAAVAVPPNTEVLVSADVYITSGDKAKITLAGSATSNGTFTAIDTAESIVSGWVHLEFTADTDSNEWIQLWLESPVASDVTYWDNAVVLPTNQSEITPPSEAEYAYDFGELFYFPLGTGLSGASDNNAYKIAEGGARTWSSYKIERDDTGVVPIRISVDKTPLTHALFIQADVDFVALTTDTATTLAPKELVVELALADIYDHMADEEEDARNLEAATILRVRAARTRRKMEGTYREFRPLKQNVAGTL